jgi:16S rRNA (cytidine1402-2'-O)-methyltransferase
MGTLFVVGTPIGNLSDISARALETLRNVDRIACEDTRHTIKLLNHFGIRRPLESYHDFNEEQKAADLVRRMKEGLNVALVSDAGTPTISDPGYRLVRTSREQEVPVVSIPGPSAAITALAASGLPSDEFHFAGFLPSRGAARRARLEVLSSIPGTLIFYEAPHRIMETLEDIVSILGDRTACVARELTKTHEEWLYGTISSLVRRVKPIGEFVLVVAGGRPKTKEPIRVEGLSRKEIVKILAERTGIPRKDLYDALLKD